MEFVTDGDPMAVLAEFVDSATPALAAFGYTFEARGCDWAHWTNGFENVIRAYAFHDGSERGVRVYGDGDHPVIVAGELSRAAVATGLRPRTA